MNQNNYRRGNGNLLSSGWSENMHRKLELFNTYPYTLYIYIPRRYLFIFVCPTLFNSSWYANYRVPAHCYTRMTPFNPNCGHEENRVDGWARWRVPRYPLCGCVMCSWLRTWTKTVTYIHLFVYTPCMNGCVGFFGNLIYVHILWWMSATRTKQNTEWHTMVVPSYSMLLSCIICYLGRVKRKYLGEGEAFRLFSILLTSIPPILFDFWYI